MATTRSSSEESRSTAANTAPFPNTSIFSSLSAGSSNHQQSSLTVLSGDSLVTGGLESRRPKSRSLTESSPLRASGIATAAAAGGSLLAPGGGGGGAIGSRAQPQTAGGGGGATLDKSPFMVDLPMAMGGGGLGGTTSLSSSMTPTSGLNSFGGPAGEQLAANEGLGDSGRHPRTRSPGGGRRRGGRQQQLMSAEEEAAARAPPVEPYTKGYSFDPSALSPQQRAQEEEEFADLLGKRLKEHEEMLVAHRRHLDTNRAWLMNQKKAAQYRPQRSMTPSGQRSFGTTPVPEGLSSQEHSEEDATLDRSGGALGGTPSRQHMTENPELIARVIASGGSCPEGRFAGRVARTEAKRQEEVQKRVAEERALEEQSRLAELEEREKEEHAAAMVAAAVAAAEASGAGTAASVDSGSISPKKGQRRGRRETEAHAQARLREKVRREAMRTVAEEEKLEEELEEVTGAPRISAMSQKLAEASRARQGLEGVPIHESLSNRDAQSRAEKWVQSQEVQETEVPAKPAITPRAAALERGGPVGDRLHLDAKRKAVEREAVVQEAQLRDLVESNMADHTPAITRKATQYKSSGAHLHSLADEQRKRRQRMQKVQTERCRSRARPAVNPQSEAIVSQMDEGTMQRLCRPKKTVAEISLEMSARGKKPTAELMSTFSPRLDRNSRKIAEKRTNSMTPARARRMSVASAESGTSEAYSRTTSEETELGEEARRRQQQEMQVNALWSEAERRDQRMQELRREKEEAELRALSFQPKLAPHSDGFITAEGPGFLERVQQWEARREQRVMEGQASLREREVLDCTFQPQIHIHGGDPNEAEDEEASFRDPPSSKLYGGDGHAWGYHKHLDRQKAARDKTQDAQRRKEEVFSNGANWTGHSTRPKEFHLRSASASGGAGGSGVLSATTSRHPQQENVSRSDVSFVSATSGRTQPTAASKATSSVGVASLVPPHQIALGVSPLHNQRRDKYLRRGERHLAEATNQQQQEQEEEIGTPTPSSSRKGAKATGTVDALMDQSPAGSSTTYSRGPQADISQLVNHYLGGSSSTGNPRGPVPVPASATNTNPPVAGDGYVTDAVRSYDAFSRRLHVPSASSTVGTGSFTDTPSRTPGREGADVSLLLGLSPVTPTPNMRRGGTAAGTPSRGGFEHETGLSTADAVAKAQQAIERANHASEMIRH